MAKLLVISSVLTLPAPNGASARILALTRALSQLGHDVHFARITNMRETQHWEAHRAEFGDANFHIVRPRGRMARLGQRLSWKWHRLRRAGLKRIGSRRQFHNALDERIPAGWRRSLRSLHKQHRFDCAIVEYVYLSKLLTALPSGVRKLIDTHDTFADRHISMSASGEPYTFFSISSGDEKRGLRRADAVLAIQEAEAIAFSTVLGGRPEVYTVSHFAPLAEPVASDAGVSAIFFGSDTLGNRDTLRFLTEQVLPIIRHRNPHFTLYVAGSVAHRIEAANNILPIGPVEDLRSLFAQSPLLLNPARMGTGIAIKVLEAWGSGVPCVSTETGARGHRPGGSGMLVVPDDDAPAFADAVIRILADQDLRQRLGDEAWHAARAWNLRQLATLQQAVAIPS